ncbi:MAG TPA: DUF4870 domain-containing protein [Nitrospirota bacterium]|nr:DUF4870 domain-containing protein [Nitrospirota bacterium]
MIISPSPADQRSAISAGKTAGPSKAWYILALLVFLLSTAGIAVEIYGIVQSFPKGTQFLVPGSVTLSVDKPGTYGLWDELSTFFENKSYQSSDELPGGMTIRVRDARSGSEVSFSPSSAGTETIGNVKRRAIGDVVLDRSGSYVIEVSGDFPQRVFYVRRSAVKEVFSGIAWVALLGTVGWIIAPVLSIIILVRRSAARNRAASPVEGRATTGPDVSGATSAKEERTYAMFCHLGALSGFVVPFGNIIVPLVLWLIKKDSSPFIDMNGRESLNFQISMLIYSLISAVLILIVVGIFLLAGLWIFNLVIVIIAGVRAESGEQFKYPLTIRFIK